jgi:epoxyqueuosine reductase
MGQHIYGCDDCQLICPWNKFAQRAALPDFDVRPALAEPDLLGLWQWDEATFLRLTEGSPIRRIGFARWQRNIAVAMGNALRTGLGPSALIRDALNQWLSQPPTGLDVYLVGEHVAWALAQQAP